MSSEREIKELLEVIEGWVQLASQIKSIVWDSLSSLDEPQEEGSNLAPVSDTVGLDYKDLHKDGLSDPLDEKSLDFENDSSSSIQP
ncbi:hypothetical protein [Legionella hackeliae]|uniref:Uncharacterized protein n=1 Tax=Legionella hackeliae TaxID=449 RepID=A0A0A8ULK0_LEGHA|nr:hypothetical protein [Legionella hackeliae]KTD10249.1 hypothetical protein Lhac_2617 [Legionella hackeliae]CEK09745.1 protein of unknown function [Legionella hackeliae]STX49655.1 Uncharacterised protein [Legionella hackeliae]